MDSAVRTLAVKIETMPAEGGPTWDPNYTPGVDFWTMLFYNLKKFILGLSNEGSNFILSSL